jgi:hypothetical protein
MIAVVLNIRIKRSAMRNNFRSSAVTPRGIQRALACSLFLLLCAGGIGCNIGKKTTILALQTNPSSIAAGTQAFVFTAVISHNNGNFAGASWTLTSNGTACSAACGTLGTPTNTGSPGNGDTSTIPYNAPATAPTPNSVTITATSVENPQSSGTDTFTITP